MTATTISFKLLLVTTALATACGDKPATGEPSGRIGLPQSEGREAPPLIGQGAAERTAAGQVAPAPDEERVEARPEVGSASFAAELARLYGAWSGEERALLADFARGLEQAIAREGVFAERLSALYQARNGQPIMSRDGALTEDAEALVKALEGVKTHGLDPKPYELTRLSDLMHAFAKGRLAADADAAPAAEIKDLWKFVLEQRREPMDEVALGVAVREHGFSDTDLGRLSETRKRLTQMLAGQKGLNATLAELDVFLSAKLYRWVYDMRLARRAHPFLADRSEADGLARVGVELDKLMAVDVSAPGEIAKLVASVVPRFPDYEPTREALQRYRDYAARYPEHIELPKDVEKLGPKKSGELVSLLEVRLGQEEYLDLAPTGKWSSDLEEALSEYQDTHQMKPTGKVDKLTRISLNKSFAERATLLALSLQRYRESDLHQGAFRFGETPIRARVNIPSMEARFYLGTELARQHRVVVGNNDVETDGETGKKGKLNQTRLFTAQMATVVLNPVWNVPKRIKEQELDTMLMDEPDYYEKHNFKVELNPDGTERVVQQPGPGNALGVVKFLFPNQFAIYMHDTPAKKLFARPVRAYSHGCMRTENPVDLARWILVEVDQKMTAEDFDATLAKREERHFALSQKIPISTDYVTTSIDADGRINFLADVYGFDRDYLEGKTPYRADKDIPMTVVF